MSWNHRVRKETVDGEDFFTIVEAFYNEKGELRYTTINGVAPVGSTIEELQQSLQWMMDALGKSILEEPIVYVADDDDKDGGSSQFGVGA